MTLRTSLTLREGMKIDAWQRVGEQLFAVADSTPWWLGDWLIYGERTFPQRYQQAVAATRLDYQTLRNYAWVCRRFRVSRRRDTLSFQHHMEVARLPEEQQDDWLERAAKGNWSRNRLRRELAGRPAADGDTTAGTVRLNVSDEQRQRWAAAAKARSQTLGAWMSEMLDAAAATS
jgi:hypothetical protein